MLKQYTYEISNNLTIQERQHIVSDDCKYYTERSPRGNNNSTTTTTVASTLPDDHDDDDKW